MRRLALLLALLAAPVLAQDLAPTTTAQFVEDSRLVTRAVAAVALLHDADGAFPSTPFELLGTRAAADTELRGTALSGLSALTIENEGPTVSLEFVPLPREPYVAQNDVIRVVVSRGDDGLYTGRYEIQRRAAPEAGGAVLDYDRAGGLIVTRAYGTACVDVAEVRAQLADGSFTAAPGSLGPNPQEILVHPDAPEPTLFGAGR